MLTAMQKLELGLDIFFNSKLASSSPVAKNSMATLKAWHKAGKLKTATSGVFASFMGNPGALTSTETLLTSDEITVYEDTADRAGPDAPAYWAMLVGHEGVHASMRAKDLDSELVAWPLQLDLYDELCVSPVTVGTASYGIGTPSRFGTLVAGNKARTTDQLIDWLLEVNVGYRAHATPDWITKNLNAWRGIPNRKRETIVVYLDKLAAPRQPKPAESALKILEQYLPLLATPADRLKLTEEIGQPLREALAIYRLHAGKPGLARIEALEKSAGVRLYVGASSNLDYQVQKKLGF